MKQLKHTMRDIVHHIRRQITSEVKFLGSLGYWTLITGIVGILTGVIGFVIYLTYFISTEPSYTIYDLPLAQPSKIYDKNNILLYTFFHEKRTPVTYDAIAPIMVDAIISTEDKDFWINDGYDLSAISRSFYLLILNRWKNGGTTTGPGGSTLTQQIVKNTIVGREKTFNRKRNELLHSRLLTYNSYKQNKQFSPQGSDSDLWNKTKKDVVTYYLNRTFFGNNAYGIYEAAEQYFSVEPKDLTIGQAAALASIPRSPYRFDLYRNPEFVLGYRSLNINGEETLIDQQSPYYDIIREKVLSMKFITEKQKNHYAPTTKDNTIWDNIKQRLINNRTPTQITLDDMLPKRTGKNKFGEWTLHYVPGRKDYVIQRLYEDRKISFYEGIQTIITPLEINEKGKTLIDIIAPHFVHYIKESIINNQSLNITEQQLYEQGYTIKTTIDSMFNTEIENLNQSYEKKLDSFGANNRSILITNINDGSIIGYIGSLDYNNQNIQGQVDMITSRRQIGSTIKPLLYALGFMKYPFGLDSIIRDQKKNFGGGFSPSNADNQNKGPMSFKKALAGSRNIPAVRITDAMGGASIIQPYLKSLGMTSLLDSMKYGLSLGLGVGEVGMIELAQSYMQFGDQEDVGMIHGISNITNERGEVIFDHQDYRYPRIIPLGVAKLITKILSTINYAPSYFREMVSVPKCPTCASKTGTTNMKVKGVNAARDAWIVTYNPEILLTIWAGNTDASAMGKEAYGFTINTDIRNDIIKLLVEKGYMSPDIVRSYPKDQNTNYKKGGEGYLYPEYKSIPKAVLNKL